MTLSRYEKIYNSITQTEDFYKKIRNRAKWKLVSLLLMTVSSLIIIFSLLVTAFWIWNGSDKDNIVGMFGLVIFIISIVLLVIADTYDPLKKIKFPPDKLYIYFYMTKKKFPSIDPDKGLFDFETLVFYDMLNLIGRELKMNEGNYKPLSLISENDFDKRFFNESKTLFFNTGNKIFERKESFNKWLDLVLEMYADILTKDDKTLAEIEYHLEDILNLIFEINNPTKSAALKPGITIKQEEYPKQKSKKILSLLPKIGFISKIILTGIITSLGIYFLAKASLIDDYATKVAYYYTVGGTTFSIIISIISFSFPKNKL